MSVHTYAPLPWIGPLESIPTSPFEVEAMRSRFLLESLLPQTMQLLRGECGFITFCLISVSYWSSYVFDSFDYHYVDVLAVL